jgi:hypothetical protein
VRIFLRGGDFEIGRFDANGIDVFQDGAGRAVLAAGIDALKNQQQGMAGVRVQQLLQLPDSPAQFLDLLLRFRFVPSAAITRIKPPEPDFSPEHNGVAIHVQFAHSSEARSVFADAQVRG